MFSGRTNLIVKRAICDDTNRAHGMTGGQLAAWLRVRYPDIIAGAISSSPTFLGAPGLGLVSSICTPLCLALQSMLCCDTMCCCYADTLSVTADVFSSGHSNTVLL